VEPPPPEPASALGTASGTLRMVDFAQEVDFWAYDKEPSDANRAKAQGQVAEEFRSAMAVWKPRSQSVVIFLFTDTLTVAEVAQLKESITTNTDVMTNGDAIHKRALAPGKVAFITVSFASRPPATGAQTASAIIESRGNSGRSYSATGRAEVQVSSSLGQAGPPTARNYFARDWKDPLWRIHVWWERMAARNASSNDYHVRLLTRERH